MKKLWKSKGRELSESERVKNRKKERERERDRIERVERSR